jgi:hypothetical protein
MMATHSGGAIATGADWLWTAFYVVGIPIMAVVLFRSRTLFGVRPREGWRTLVRTGWWVLLVEGVLQVCSLAVWVGLLRVMGL